MNYWRRWIGSIQKKTAHLSPSEMGVYDRLLDHYYAHEAPLPLELDRCCRIAGAVAKQDRAAVASVLDEFFDRTDGGHVNKRAEEEMHDQRPKIDAARANGLRGGRPKKPNAKPSGLPDGLTTGTHEEPSAESSTTTSLVPTEPRVSDGAKAPSSSAEPTARAARQAKTPEIPPPYEAIVDLYHEALPQLPKVRLRDGPTWEDRRKAMAKVWRWVLTSKRSDGTRRATSGDEGLAWFRGYFARASENDFVMGRTGRGHGHEGWVADFDFLLTKRGMKQVIEKTKDAA